MRAAIRQILLSRRVLPYSVNFAAMADGVLPGWVGSTWSVATGKAVNTPVLENEIVTNPEFTTNTNGYSVVNGATLTRRDFASSPDIDPTGGADEYGLEVLNNGSAGAAGSWGPSATASNWYMISVRAYSPSANGATNAADMLPTDGFVNTGARATATEDAWQTLLYAPLTTAATPTVRLRANGNNTDKSYFDALSIKLITKANLLAYYNRQAKQTKTVKAAWTITTKCGAGVIGWWDGVAVFQNCLLAYHDGTNAVLVKYVGATRSQLISTAATYSAGAYVEIRRTAASTFQLWYNNSQVGADQTVSDVEIINNGYFGLFSTYSGNQCTAFALNP